MSPLPSVGVANQREMITDFSPMNNKDSQKLDDKVTKVPLDEKIAV